MEEQALDFTVTATDADSTVPTLSADVSGLPGNPSFSDWGDGSGRLNWTPPLNSPGTYTLVIRATDAVDSSLYSEQTVTITVETVPVTTGNFVYQESAGLVVMEGEHYINQEQSFENYNWELITPAEAVGEGAIVAPAGASVSPSNGFTTDNARVDYAIDFTQTGTYYLWIRGYAPNSTSRTFYPGMDGIPHSSGKYFVIPPPNGWSWSNVRQGSAGNVFTFEVSSPGVHHLNLWMRESGVIIDRILLTTDSSFVPNGNGPEESQYE